MGPDRMAKLGWGAMSGICNVACVTRGAHPNMTSKEPRLQGETVSPDAHEVRHSAHTPERHREFRGTERQQGQADERHEEARCRPE